MRKEKSQHLMNFPWGRGGNNHHLKLIVPPGCFGIDNPGLILTACQKFPNAFLILIMENYHSSSGWSDIWNSTGDPLKIYIKMLQSNSMNSTCTPPVVWHSEDYSTPSWDVNDPKYDVISCLWWQCNMTIRNVKTPSTTLIYSLVAA